MVSSNNVMVYSIKTNSSIAKDIPHLLITTLTSLHLTLWIMLFSSDPVEVLYLGIERANAWMNVL